MSIMVKEINVYSNEYNLAKEVASEVASWIENSVKSEGICTIALSGGRTPVKLFEILKNKYANSIPWDSVHIFWVDERCVAPTDAESNYANANKHLLKFIDIPKKKHS